MKGRKEEKNDETGKKERDFLRKKERTKQRNKPFD